MTVKKVVPHVTTSRSAKRLVKALLLDIANNSFPPPWSSLVAWPWRCLSGHRGSRSLAYLVCVS